MKTLFCALLALVTISLPAPAQVYKVWQHDVDLMGNWTFMTGNGSLNGFSVGTSYFLQRHVAIAFNYDSGWNNSTVGLFQLLPTVGLTTTHSQLQNWLFGPRVFLPGLLKGKTKIKGKVLRPFAEVMFGESNLYTQLRSAQVGNVSAADTAFTWMVGGGADFNIANHWAVRTNIDLLRTHFASMGQSRLRFGLGVAYSFKGHPSD
jgi:Outer membrane protein beta-barrel domain